jgi:hypothetical protein
MGGGKGGGSKSVTVGYKYYMGLHLVVCQGPVDSLNKIYAGERIIRDGAVTSSNRILISAENVFGGEEKEGGIKGYVDVMFGEATQAQNAYLQSKITTNIPAFRGVLSLVCNQIYFAAMNPYPKAWWMEVTRIPDSDWESSYADINSGSANGAHIIRETLMDTTWGLGYPLANIDNDSFAAAAETLYDEGLGLSIALHAQNQVEEFLQIILRHINGVLVTDRLTGKFKLKLIRDDYTPASLPLFDDSNIISLSNFQRPSYGELVNEVVVVYRLRGNSKDDALAFQNLASIQAQGAVISQTLQYPAIDNRTTAALIGQREIKQQSTPLATATLIVNRQGWDIEPGDAIRFSWPEYGIVEMVLRVNKVDYGDLTSGKITLICSEDVFGLPSVSYVEPQNPVWSDPLTDPVATNASDVKIAETPYYDLATYLPSTPNVVLDQLEATDVYMQFMAALAFNAPAASGFEVWTKLSSAPDSAYVATTSGGYTPVGILESAIGYTDETDIELSAETDFDVFEDDLDSVYGYIDDEVVSIVSITSPTDIALGKVTIGRGALDTVPAEHVAGSRLWIAHREAAYDPTEYQETTVLDCKFLQITGKGTYELALASAVSSGALVARQFRPYPPARVQFSGLQLADLYYPEFIYGANATQISWVDRNRLQQTTTPLLDFFDSGITIEATATYTLRYFGLEDLNALPAGASKITTGLSSASAQSWSTELTDAPVGRYAPTRTDEDLWMTFSSGDIGGSLSDETTAQNVTNVTFSDMVATFAAGYCDLGDWLMDATNWSILITFNPDDVGDDYQLIWGKFTDDGLGGGTDIVGLYWRRTDHSLYSTRSGAAKNPISNTYCLPGIDHHLLISKDSSGNGTVYLEGIQRAVAAYDPSNFIGRDWTLGGAWQPQSATRIHLFSGTMKDLRVWQDVNLANSDIFPTVDQPNKAIRVRLTTVRDTVDSYQSFDYTVKRTGWSFTFGDNFNGRI